jgi:hypothetical protein
MKTAKRFLRFLTRLVHRRVSPTPGYAPARDDVSAMSRAFDTIAED